MTLGCVGNGLFSDDVACDVRDHYRQLLEDGVEDGDATRLTVEAFREYLEESSGIALLAFAVTQSKLGRLDPDIRDRALAVLDRGADLEMWERDNPKLLPKRRAMLEKARAQLTGQQPLRRRLRPPKRISSGLAAGDVLALALPRRVVLLRVVRVRSHRLGETPVLEELDFEGTEVPPRDALERLGPKSQGPDRPRATPCHRTRGSSHSSCSASIGRVPVSGRCRRSALAPATRRRRCQAPAFRGLYSPSATAFNRRSNDQLQKLLDRLPKRITPVTWTNQRCCDGFDVPARARPTDYSNPVNPLGTLLPRVRFERFERVR